jgi:hypothetical protein
VDEQKAITERLDALLEGQKHISSTLDKIASSVTVKPTVLKRGWTLAVEIVTLIAGIIAIVICFVDYVWR